MLADFRPRRLLHRRPVFRRAVRAAESRGARRKRPVAALSLLALAAARAPLGAADDGEAIRRHPLEIAPLVRFWRASPSGDMTITAGGRPGSGSRIDLSSDLDAGAADSVAGGLALSAGPHELAFRYHPASFHGEAVLRRDLVFHGATYPAGERVKSDVALDLAIPEYAYRLPSPRGAGFHVGLRGYVWTFAAELRGTGRSGRLDESRRFTHFLPAGTVGSAVALGRWRLGAEVAGGALASDRHAVDAEALVAFRPVDAVELSAGYRWLRFRFRETTNVGRLTAAGPQLSLTVHFSPSAFSPWPPSSR